MPNQNEVKYVPAGTGPMYWGPGDRVSFLATGVDSQFQAGGQTIYAKPGDFIHIPRGTVHSLKNEGKVPARALIITSPAGPTGMQQFVEESFYPTKDASASPPPITEELVKRMMASAARNGLELVKPA
jgi:uncharacterized RmlC-like cupin family protein